MTTVAAYAAASVAGIDLRHAPYFRTYSTITLEPINLLINFQLFWVPLDAPYLPNNRWWKIKPIKEIVLFFQISLIQILEMKLIKIQIWNYQSRKVIKSTKNCNQITQISILGKMKKEILKMLHSWLHQVPQHGHLPHPLDLGHLDYLALAVVNIFEMFLFHVAH